MKGLPIFLIVALIAIVFASLPPIAFTADDPFVCPADAYRPLRVDRKSTRLNSSH